MPLARWLLLTVVLFFHSVLYQTTELQKEVFPSPEQNQSKLATDLIFSDLELKGIEKQALMGETYLVKANDQAMRMPGQGTKKTLVSVLALWAAECILE